MLDNTTDSVVNDTVADAAAKTTASTKSWYKRKVVYYTAGGIALVGTAVAVAYIFIPGLRGVTEAVAETAVEVVTETVV